MEYSSQTAPLGIGGKPYRDTLARDIRLTTDLTNVYTAEQNCSVQVHVSNDSAGSRWVRVEREYGGLHSVLTPREALQAYEHSIKPISYFLREGASLYASADQNGSVDLHLEITFER